MADVTRTGKKGRSANADATRIPALRSVSMIANAPTSRPHWHWFLSTWRWRGWFLVVCIQAIGAGQVPLAGVLGYELALWAAVVASVMGLDLGAAYTRHRTQQPSTRSAGHATELTTVAGMVAAAVTLTWIPLAALAFVAAIRGIWIPTCDWTFGITCFVAMPVASGGLAAGLGVALELTIGRRRWLGTMIPIAFLLLLVSVGIARFYGAPPVFSYNPIVGYFPGNLYDEHIELSSALAWARLEALLWVIAGLATAAATLDVATMQCRIRGTKATRPRAVAALLALSSATSAFWVQRHSGDLGYAINTSDVRQALAGELETEHFVIHYSRTEAIVRDLQLIADDHELRLAQVTAVLGVAPSQKIHSYYFANGDEKARWIGARDVEMAKPWRREIYLEHRDFPHASLRHEIAHIVAAEFGDRWFGISARLVAGLPLFVNPGLIEGLAVAADWPGGYDRELTPHQATRAMQELGFTPSIDVLLSLGFLSLSSARSYTTAGSFVRFLLDELGASALRRVYQNGGDFAAAYGKSPEVLQQRWQAFIAAIELSRDEVNATKERFRQVGVFARPCPHAIAARRAGAFEAVQRGDRPHAVSLLREVCQDAPEEPNYRMELADLLVRGRGEEQDEALQVWSAIINGREEVTSSLRSEALQRLAGLSANALDWGATRTLIEQALELAINDSQRRQLEAKQLALQHVGPAAFALRGYFFPPAQQPGDPRQWAMWAAALEPRLGFAIYLRGLRQADTGSWAAMAADMASALRLGLPSRSFVRNAARRLAVAAYRAADQSLLAIAIDTLNQPEMTETDRLLAADWQQRARFAESRRRYQ
jgi:hypothetical protein